MTEKAWIRVTAESWMFVSQNNGSHHFKTVTFPVLFLLSSIYMHGKKENDSEATQERKEIRMQKQTKKRKSVETVRGYKF